MTFLNTEARINYLEFICEQLQDTSSLNEKRDIINTMEDECKDDFNFIIEILANKYPLGYKYDGRRRISVSGHLKISGRK